VSQKEAEKIPVAVTVGQKLEIEEPGKAPVLKDVIVAIPKSSPIYKKAKAKQEAAGWMSKGTVKQAAEGSKGFMVVAAAGLAAVGLMTLFKGGAKKNKYRSNRRRRR